LLLLLDPYLGSNFFFFPLCLAQSVHQSCVRLHAVRAASQNHRPPIFTIAGAPHGSMPNMAFVGPNSQ
jgi:hypothetical protein